MFKFLYNLWLFFFKFVNNNRFFLKKINILQKQFISLTYFNKLFVIFFYNDLHSLNNIISDVRRKKYPLIHTFYVNQSFLNAQSSRSSLKQLNKEINFLLNNSNEYDFFKNFVNSSLVVNYYFLVRFFNKYFHHLSSKLSHYKIIFVLIELTKVLFNNASRTPSYRLYNLNFYTHWYKYNFDNNKFIFPVLSIPKNFSDFILSKKNILKNFYSNNDIRNSNLVVLNSNIKTNTVNLFPIKFNETSTNKHINFDSISEYFFLFLRKNRIFNKGRYSRNRQLYRTGFYWCLYFNIISVFGLYFVFYRVVFNFGYLWIFLIVFFGSFLFSRSLKYNFVSFKYIYNEIVAFFNWISFFFKNLVDFFKNTLFSFCENLFEKKKLFSFENITFVEYSKSVNNFNNYFLNFEIFKFNFFWNSLHQHDYSFLKLKNQANYVSQLMKFIRN